MKQFLITLSDAIKNGILRIFPKLAIVFAIAIACSGCGAQRQIAVVDRIHQDTLYVSNIQYDSIYIDNWQYIDRSADTIYKERVKLEYRYKLLRDTVYKVQIDSIPVIKEVEVIQQVKFTPWYAKTFAWLGVILLLALIIRIAIKLYFHKL